MSRGAARGGGGGVLVGEGWVGGWGSSGSGVQDPCPPSIAVLVVFGFFVSPLVLGRRRATLDV